MILYINPDNNLLVGDPKFRNPVSKLLYKRRDGGIVRLGFAGEPQADPSRMIKIGVKLLDDFDAPDFLVYANSYFTLPNSPYYYIAPDFNTVALNALFTPNLTSVSVSLEVSWSEDSGVSWNSSQVVEVQVFNDLIQGGEFFPTPLSSFESQIIPILASFTYPINIFNNNLTVSNGSIVVSGSASNITTPYLIANTINVSNISATNTFTNTLDVSADRIRIRNTLTPANSAAPGNFGDIAFDLNYLYVRTLSGWKRSPLTLF